MKILVLSDLHLEFHCDCGESFLHQTDWPDHDVTVIAGDISNSKKLFQALETIYDTFGDKPIVYTAGNHEYYGSSVYKVNNTIHKFAAKHCNLHWLQNRPINIDQQRFTGGVMWTPKSDDRIAKSLMNDFACIKHFEQVYEDHQDFTEHVLPHIQPDDIVVTHHLPSFRSVPAQFKGSSLNQFFVNDVESTIVTAQPKLWIHGHTHTCFDYTIGPTRVVANPFGYPGENSRWEPRVVEL